MKGIVWFLLILLFISGCSFGTSGGKDPYFQIGNTIYSGEEELKTFSYNCTECKFLTDCPSQEEYCESKGYFESFSKPFSTGKFQILPVRQTTCTYFCVDEENFEKQKQNQKYWLLECSWQEDHGLPENDFTFTKKFSINTQETNLNMGFNLGYSNENPVELISIKGKGEFSGEMSLTDEWDDEIGGHHMTWRGFRNTKPLQKIQNGIIEFTYLKGDQEKTFSSICKSNV